MRLLFERSVPGRQCYILPECDVPVVELDAKFKRASAARLPELGETDISRHYTELAEQTFGVNNGFYPLGSCTMKYNPKINDEMANLPGFAKIHPLQPEDTVQGALEALVEAQERLSKVTGMDQMTLQPAAGAQGEFTGILLMKAYHQSRGDHKRNKIIVPDSAHGTNPATANMAGYKIINIDSNEDGGVDLEKLKAAVGDDTAGLMLTNPNTLGIFDPNILEITKIIHDAGGVNYYDGANLNAIMGVALPGEMGFDVIHLNLHKTFSTPHGGGGPGSGAVGCKNFLAEFLPGPQPVRKGDGFAFEIPKNSVGRMKDFYGNFGVNVRALTYVLTHGCDGLKAASQNAVMNANYIMESLKDVYTIAYIKNRCMHECVLTLEPEVKKYGFSAMDVAKGLLDNGIHPPTMYFPLNVPEALMIEPTETESKETMDEAIAVFKKIYEIGKENPQELHDAPKSTYVRRLDEVGAARNPILKFQFS